MSGPGALCRGPALFLSGPGALCRGPALFVSGPGAPCVGARRSLSGVGVRARRSSPKTLFSRYRLALSVAVCVRRCLCRGPALCVGARPPALSRPGAPCVGARCCRGHLNNGRGAAGGGGGRRGRSWSGVTFLVTFFTFFHFFLALLIYACSLFSLLHFFLTRVFSSFSAVFG